MFLIGKRKIFENCIKVQTRKATDISNCQVFSMSPFERNQFSSYERRYQGVIFRNLPTAIYNCHGLVFASRRTGIFEVEEIYKILKEDNYTEVNPNDVLPGDIVLYFSVDGDIEHSGVVVSAPDTITRLPKIYSKWGKYCEAVHYANICPYECTNLKYYRTDK